MKYSNLLLLAVFTFITSGSILPEGDQQSNIAGSAVFTRGLEKRLNALGEKLLAIQANLRCHKKPEKADTEDCIKGKKKVDALAKLDTLTDEFFEHGNFKLSGRVQILLRDITHELEGLIQACLDLPELSLPEKSKKLRDFKARQKILKCRTLANLSLEAIDAVEAIAQFVSGQDKKSVAETNVSTIKNRASLQVKLNRVNKAAQQADEIIRYTNACAQGKREACKKVHSYNQ